MQRNGVPYIIGFCVAVCLVCAIIVSSSAVGLKERQETNKLFTMGASIFERSGRESFANARISQACKSITKTTQM